LLLTSDIGFVYLLAGREAGNALMRGFTSVGDMTWPNFRIKRAIDTNGALGNIC